MSGNVADIPDRMTVNAGFEERPLDGTVIRGHPLTQRMVRYLDAFLRGFTIRQRAQQLEQINPEAYRVYELHQKGLRPPAIARTIGCSERTAERRLKTALAYVLAGGAGDLADTSREERQVLLGVEHPRLSRVHELRLQGLTYTEIAKVLGVSTSTVERRAAQARRFIDGAEQEAGEVS